MKINENLEFLLKSLINKEFLNLSPHPYKSQAEIKEQIFLESKQAFKDYLERLKNGVSLIQKENLLEPQDQKNIKAILRKLNKHPAILQKELALSSEKVLSFYQYGRSLYQRNFYSEASDIFLLLTTLNPSIAPFWISLGTAEQMNHRLDGAALAYLMALDLDQEHLEPALPAAKCFIGLNKPDQARLILQEALAQIGEGNAHEPFKTQAQQLLKTL